MDSKRICFACAMLAALSMATAHATTKVDDGFTTGFVGNGDDAKPANHVSSVRQGNDVYYWLDWNDHPSGVVTVRCVIKDSPDGEPLVDQTEASDGPETEGFTVCGMGTDDADFEPGTFYFEQWIDGELVGKRSIEVLPRFAHTRRSMYKEFKYWLGALAAVILGIGWVKRKLGKEGTGPIDPPLMPETAKAEKAREALVIGANVSPGIAAREGGIELPKNQDASRSPRAQYEAFKERIARDADFRPERGADAFAIAKAARAAGDARTAVAALRGFDKAFPSDPLVPEVYVFSAKLMAEDLGNADMARRILEHVVQKYPGHFVAQEAKKYLQSFSLSPGAPN